MKISDFDYDLPPEKIAIYPPTDRGTSRLLVVDRQRKTITHDVYANLDKYLLPGDVLILNDTKVEKSRLICMNESSQKEVELMILERHNLEVVQRNEVTAIYRGRLKKNDHLTIDNVDLSVENVLEGGIAKISSQQPIEKIQEAFGTIPIPPYLHRDTEPVDLERYQTVFAKNAGSAAAPTASLNFTDTLKQKIIDKGVEIHYLTLHVGLGTFLPVRSDDVEEHTMHSEFYYLSDETITALRSAVKEKRRIAAIGTTVTRTLESISDNIFSKHTFPDGISGEADIFIYPGYSFKLVDTLITNFHAPRSTVLLLAAAFTGDTLLRQAYQEALENDYSFLSYGDSMLIL